MYRNQRAIFTPLFLTPIIRTLKTEEGEFSRPGEGQITSDLAPGGQIPGGKEQNPCDTGSQGKSGGPNLPRVL